jgi:allantoinase
VSSLQLGLSLIWTEARRRGIGLEQVVEWMAVRPAELVRLSNKGKLALGYHADLSILAPDDSFVVDPAKLHHKNRSPPTRRRRCPEWSVAPSCGATRSAVDCPPAS